MSSGRFGWTVSLCGVGPYYESTVCLDREEDKDKDKDDHGPYDRTDGLLMCWIGLVCS